MRLATASHLIPQQDLDQLTAAGIITHSDLLFHSNAYAAVPKIPRRTLDRYASLVAEHVSAKPLDLVELAQEATPPFEPLSVGIPSVDQMLEGVGSSQVIEVSGDRGTGKTSLALQIVICALRRDHSSALWIDTTGDFSAERCLAFLDEHEVSVLERLQASTAINADAIFELLDELDGNTDWRPTHIIIDNITSIISPLLTAVSAQGHSIMTALMRQFRILARSHNITILILNNSTSNPNPSAVQLFSDSPRKPALGPSFTYMTDATIWLSRAPKSSAGAKEGEITFELVRSRFSPSGTSRCRVLDGMLIALQEVTDP